jgi:pyruvate/2-oxoglutarate dehydrogenase complex dihydrolipoamide dehydrogenase (E3) component
MNPESFDAVVVGAGQAGPSLAVRFAQHGWRTALVERAELGGTCVNSGCMPTKTLVASARVAHLARRAADFGIRLGGPVEVDFPAVMARAHAVTQDSRDSLADWLRDTPGLEWIRAQARFAAPDTLALSDGRRLRAPRIFLNVGARAVVPDWIAASGVPFLTNETILGLRALPAHLVILGGGYIALEYAQVFRRLGSAVTVLEHGPRFLPREDADAADAVRAVLEREGIAIRLGVDANALARTGTGISLGLAGGERIEGSQLLVAIGRRPNTDTLDLERAGLVPEPDGTIAVDDQLRTRVPGIWAVGDVNGRGAFTHTSYNDHEIVVADLLEDDPRRASERIPVYALFTDPPLARIGIAKAAGGAPGRAGGVGRLPMTGVGRGMV